LTIKIPYGKYDESITLFADAIKKLYIDDRIYNALSSGALKMFREKFDWNIKGAQLKEIYEKVMVHAS
jgi:glycosyltransferase involved in cell wall biosynthesis